MIDKLWPTVAPMFERLTRESSGCYEPDDVLAEIKAGEQQLWVAWDEVRLRVDAVMTTSIRTYPRRKSIRIIYIVGDRMRHWFSEFEVQAEAFGRREGATLLEGFGRKGWLRLWSGVRLTGVGYSKEI
jgi:hypothetical protein